MVMTAHEPKNQSMEYHVLLVCRVIASRKHSGEKREMKISEARPIIEDLVSERLISDDAVGQSRDPRIIKCGPFQDRVAWQLTMAYHTKVIPHRILWQLNAR